MSAAWGVLFLTDTLEVWHAAVLLSVHGLAGVLWIPATQLIVHDIAGRAICRAPCGSFDFTPARCCSGPAIGGVMLLTRPGVGHPGERASMCRCLYWLWKAPYGARGATPGGRADRPGLSDIPRVMREIAGNRTSSR